ncbi:MAG: hypothetical protein U5K51_04390 [Flavobacteriaceae bacterium]|nr:hypothetical protein [Flavobacteriaceae bacterium]
MKFRYLFLLITIAQFLANQNIVAQKANPLEGRWDLVIDQNGQKLPSWLEVSHSGNKTLVGRFVYAFGSARPVAEVKVKDGKIRFAIPHNGNPGSGTWNLKVSWRVNK